MQTGLATGVDGIRMSRLWLLDHDRSSYSSSHSIEQLQMAIALAHACLPLLLFCKPD